MAGQAVRPRGVDKALEDPAACDICVTGGGGGNAPPIFFLPKNILFLLLS